MTITPQINTEMKERTSSDEQQLALLL